jgi:hypothetical protein
MSNIDRVRDPLVSSYYDNTAMLDCAIAIDGFFDDIALLYAYKNWYDGEVVAGPSVKKYWVTIILKYDYKDMPEPNGAKVLCNLGCKVFYKKFKQKVGVPVVGPQDLDQRHRPKTTIEPCWLVKIVIPKKFIDNEELQGMDELDNDIDIDQVEETLNDGGGNSALVDNQQVEPAAPQGQPPQTGGMPAQPGNVPQPGMGGITQ